MSAPRLASLTALTMLGFAANSILNRLAVSAGLIDPISFAVIRVLSGAAILVVIVLVRRRGLPVFAPGRVGGALSLSLYLVGFSIAYIHLDAGLGALILFGMVQITMFAGALASGETVARARWIGAAVALAGLAWLLWPAGAVRVPLIGAVAMGLAGIGWGLYSLIGRRAGDPLAATAANFVLAAPILVAVSLLMPVQLDATQISAPGVGLAVLSGSVTSGLGYALWYSVLPRLAASVAGLVQLSVPVIAVLGGAWLLGEVASWRVLGAGAVVLGGIAFGLLAGRQRKIGSNGS
jgi:drug/metabolite transporter (DMT)-like permease